MAREPSARGEVPQAVPGRRQVSRRHRAELPVLGARPGDPAADEYQRKLSFEITEALAKRKSPKDALDTAAKEWDKVTERRGVDKQKAFWGEKLFEMKQLGIEYRPEWAAKAK